MFLMIFFLFFSCVLISFLFLYRRLNSCAIFGHRKVYSVVPACLSIYGVLLRCHDNYAPPQKTPMAHSEPHTGSRIILQVHRQEVRPSQVLQTGSEFIMLMLNQTG